MSTILKSLRKLEEEKRAHGKKLNLKDLMIREEGRPPVQSVLTGNHRRWGSGVLLIGAGLTVAVFMFMLMTPAKNNSSQSGTQGVGEQTAGNKQDSLPINNPEHQLAGVPLSSIPDYSPKKAPSKVQKVSKDSLSLEQETLPVEPVPVAPAQSAPVETVPQPVTRQKENPSTPADQEIISAFEQVPAQKRTSMTPNPSLPVIRPLSAEEVIPGLKLKGIVFFEEGSEENYLFFTLPGMSIHRLKVGEAVMEAKLIEIYPGLAVFSYQDRRVELRVGR